MNETETGHRQEDSPITTLALDPQNDISADDMDDDPRLDVEAELLCAVLWAQPNEARRVVETITPGDFERPVYAALYGQIAKLVAASKPHDSAHVALTLSREGLTAGHHGKQLTTALADVTTLGCGRC